MICVCMITQRLWGKFIDNSWRSDSKYSVAGASQRSERFLQESLEDLDKNLKRLDQRLVIAQSASESTLSNLIEQVDASHVFRSDNAG